MTLLLGQYYRVVDDFADTSPAVYSALTIARRGLIIHATVGRDSRLWLKGGSAAAGSPASADQLIAKDGTIRQLIPPGHYAYHSGNAIWRGWQDKDATGNSRDTVLNRSFYGIEIENLNDGRDPYTFNQYVASASTWTYKSAVGRLLDLDCTDHASVALPPGRKSDAYGFDWGLFWRLVWQIRGDWPLGWPPVWLGGEARPLIRTA